MVGDRKLANAPVLLASDAHQQHAPILDVGTSTTVEHVASSWRHPLPRRYKCNIDATFSSHSNRTCIGYCFRDSDGTFVLAKTVTYPCIVPVDVGEVLGLHAAVQWLSDMQFNSVDFEMDSKLTVDAFLSTKNDTSEFGSIISSCRSLFSSVFSNSRVEFIRRQANRVAHALARDALLLSSLAVYYDIHNCIEYLIINEMLYVTARFSVQLF